MATKKQHTVGPWRLAQSKGGQWFIYAAGDTQPLRPCVKLPKSFTQVAFANARLMAAAPAMFAALKTVVRQMEGRHPVGHDAFLAARRAVSEAEADGD